MPKITLFSDASSLIGIVGYGPIIEGIAAVFF